MFLTRGYTNHEIRYCQDRKRAMEHFAGRWAAKEAVLKCLGTGWRRGTNWTDVEVRNDPNVPNPPGAQGTGYLKPAAEFLLPGVLNVLHHGVNEIDEAFLSGRRPHLS